MMRRIRRSRRPSIVRLLVVFLLIALGWLAEGQFRPNSSQNAERLEFQPGMYHVQRVVDGDTLLLVDRRIRARLQGIDTPETVKEGTPVEPWGPEATAYTEGFIRDAGGSVYLSVDGEPLDRYGRRLVFVWHDGRLLNEELVANGLARATLNYSFSGEMKDRLRRAEQAAQASGVGIWSE